MSVHAEIHPPVRGRLIVIEGIDGTGKSTQARLLAEWLRRDGRKVELASEPTNGRWGLAARESAMTNLLSAIEELELFLNDRREHVAEFIEPTLAAGSWMVLDRYYFSTMAYQRDCGLGSDEIRALNEAFAPPPDALLVLDLPVTSALARIRSRGLTAYEMESRANLDACREIFLSAATASFARLIPAEGEIEDVALQLRDAVSEILPDA